MRKSFYALIVVGALVVGLVAAFVGVVVGSLVAATGASAQVPLSPTVKSQTPVPAAIGEPDRLDERLDLDSREKPLGGALRTPELWAGYKARFVTESGRVVDTANGVISHSESQGYGMLLAVAANDRVAFDRIWTWTRANLMVRDDQLLAWRWEPNARPAIADLNDASDGDLLVAWALTEAAEFWGDLSYRVAARRIAVEIGRKLLLLGGDQVPQQGPQQGLLQGPLLLPAVAGFAHEDRPDGPILNLSYWVFPAFRRLPKVAPEVDWSGLTQSGLALLKSAHFGPAGLPTDWVSGADGELRPASGFPRSFSYNAIRIPLYMAFAGVGDRANYAPFVALWSRDRTLAPVDVDSGASGPAFGESGYNQIAALTLCAAQKTALPYEFFAQRPSDNYYPATLQILAVIAAQMRYGSCSRS